MQWAYVIGWFIPVGIDRAGINVSVCGGVARSLGSWGRILYGFWGICSVCVVLGRGFWNLRLVLGANFLGIPYHGRSRCWRPQRFNQGSE